MAWDIIEDVVMPILDAAAARTAAGVETPWYKVRADDVRILAAAMRQPYEDVRKRLSLDEVRGVSQPLVELLRISGFTMPGEAEAASGSTGTSTDSSPDSSTTDSPA
jgi:hypothetical protein